MPRTGEHPLDRTPRRAPHDDTISRLLLVGAGVHNLSSQHAPTAGGPGMTFNGFISYSHAADGRLAPAVQRGLHRLAKPWHRRRALWIFRDQTGLAVTPGLWSSIQTALDGSEYFVLLASPEAAQSPWVNREIEHWIATKSADRVLPVVTDGEWVWNDERGDFTEDSTAVPPALRGTFTEEPFFLDLRWARGSEHLSLHHSRFRDAIAQLAAPMHGVSKDELEGEDVRQHRRARRLRSGAAATLVVLALLASVTGMSAVRNAERARAAAAEALRQQQVANGQRSSAERSAEEARRQQELAQQQQARAARAAAEAERSERLAQQQQELADRAAADARRQRRLADQATDRTREQQGLAREASDRAQRLQAKAQRLQAEAQRLQAEAQRLRAEAQRLRKEAQRLARVAAEQRRLAHEAAAEARRQQAKADQQQRVAVSRRLMNQAASSIVDDPRTALMLGAAAAELSTDPVSRGQLTGLITATNYAGTLGDVTTTAYGPDGVLAALGTDGRVSLWNVAEPRRPVRIAGLRDAAAAGSSLEFSRDGRTLAVVGAERKAVLWDVAVRSRPVRLATLSDGGRVTAFAFSGDGTTFVTGDSSGNTTGWDTTDRTRPARLFTANGHYPVARVAISPNGRLLLVDEGRFVPFYDLTDRAHPVSLPVVLAFGASPMTFSPDGSMLAVGESDGSVVLYDMTHRIPARTVPEQDLLPPPPPDPDAPPPTPPMPPMPGPDDDPIDRLTGLSGQVRSVAFSPDGSLVVAGDENGTARLWDRRKTASPGVFAGVRARGPINALSFDPAAGVLVTADGSATATLWNVTPPGAPNSLATLTGPDERTRATVFSPDGRSLVAAGSGGTARTWNTADPAHPVRGADLALRGEAVRAVAFSPDRRTVATAAESGTLTVADPRRPARGTTLAVAPEQVRATNAMAFSPDGRTLAVIAGPATLMLWDVADPARPALLSRSTGISPGTAMAFSPDGRTLATAAKDGPAVTLWNLADRSAPVRLATLVGHSEVVYALAFSPDGRTLASGGFDRTAMLWDVTDRARPRRLATLARHSLWVTSVAFSPDGRTLAVGGGDAAVTLWDTADPAAPVALATVRTTAGAQVSAVTFRRDGRTLAVTEQLVRLPATVTLWNLSKLNRLRADPAGYACAITGRGLTAAEWARFVPEVRYRRTCAH
jgi:WD40 repeat protein